MEKENCQQTLSQMPKALASVLNSVLTSTSSLPNCETGPNQNDRAITIGKPPSAIVLNGLRDIAREASTGTEVKDENLLALLRQHFGSRLVTRQKTQEIYDGDGGYDWRISGYEIDLDGLDNQEMPFFDALEFFNKPAKPEAIAGCFAKMRTALLRRNETEQDIEILIDTMVDLCRPYPLDVILSVTRQWLKEKKFFPIPKEFIALCEEKILLRRALLKTFEECRNPLMASKREAKQIKADPRLGIHFKALEKKDWLPCHFEAWIAEAEKMADMYASNGNNTKADEWKAEGEQRRATWQS